MAKLITCDLCDKVILRGTGYMLRVFRKLDGLEHGHADYCDDCFLNLPLAMSCEDEQETEGNR